MREIPVAKITAAVARMVQDSCLLLPSDVYQALQDSLEREPSPVGRNILGALLENADIARQESIPICQDCGLAFVFLTVGQDVHFVGGSLEEAINAGVAQGYQEGYLRKSVVNDPLFDRVNTQDNTPAIIHTRIIPGDRVHLTVATKGFGSENQSVVRMLVPADGVDGVKRVVLEAVKAAGPGACPPLLVGVGIGGSLETAALCAKRAAIRSFDQPPIRPRQLRDVALFHISDDQHFGRGGIIERAVDMDALDRAFEVEGAGAGVRHRPIAAAAQGRRRHYDTVRGLQDDFSHRLGRIKPVAMDTNIPFAPFNPVHREPINKVGHGRAANA